MPSHAFECSLRSSHGGKSNDKDQILTLRDRVAELESLLAARTKERDQTIQKEFDLAKETERQQDVICDVEAYVCVTCGI
jgi:hypothetical protein